MLLAFLAMVLALGAIARQAQAGAIVRPAVEAASHANGGSFLGALQDATLY